jgi:hypothetical protein
MLQWRLEQPTVLLFAACWLSLSTRGAITGPAAILRATPRRASPGGTCHRGSYLHDAVREPTRTSFARGVPRWTPGGIYTCEFSQWRWSLILWNLEVHYPVPKMLLLDTVMSQLNTVHSFTSCFFQGYNIESLLRPNPRSHRSSPTLRFFSQTLCAFLVYSMQATCSFHLFIISKKYVTLWN